VSHTLLISKTSNLHGQLSFFTLCPFEHMRPPPALVVAVGGKGEILLFWSSSVSFRARESEGQGSFHVSVKHCLDCDSVWFLRLRQRERGHSTFLLNIALIVFGFLDPERQGSFHVSVEHCLDLCLVSWTRTERERQGSFHVSVEHCLDRLKNTKARRGVM
jgi:hypothetical protein